VRRLLCARNPNDALERRLVALRVVQFHHEEAACRVAWSDARAFESYELWQSLETLHARPKIGDTSFFSDTGAGATFSEARSHDAPLSGGFFVPQAAATTATAMKQRIGVSPSCIDELPRQRSSRHCRQSDGNCTDRSSFEAE
jgi:hypothetical protein